MIGASQILAFIARAKKLTLKTPTQGRPFECEADATGLYLKNSQGKPRKIGRAELEDFCKEYVKTGARSSSHYHAQTFNSSYLLAIVDAFESEAKKGA
jgi:hypothetical protein